MAETLCCAELDQNVVSTWKTSLFSPPTFLNSEEIQTMWDSVVGPTDGKHVDTDIVVWEKDVGNATCLEIQRHLYHLLRIVRGSILMQTNKGMMNELRHVFEHELLFFENYWEETEHQVRAWNKARSSKVEYSCLVKDQMWQEQQLQSVGRSTWANEDEPFLGKWGTVDANGGVRSFIRMRINQLLDITKDRARVDHIEWFHKISTAVELLQVFRKRVRVAHQIVAARA